MLVLLFSVAFGVAAREMVPTDFVQKDEAFYSVGKKDGSVRIFDKNLEGFKILTKINDKLTGITLDGNDLIISAGEGVGNLYRVNSETGVVIRKKELGHNLMSPKVTNDKLLVCDRFRNQLHILNKNSFALIKTVNTVPEVVSVDTTDDGLAITSGIMPIGAGPDHDISAYVGIIDIEAGKEISRVKLPPGSTSVRSVAVCPNNEYAVVNHVLGRFMVPTTQIDRGWINTNALSIIKLDDKKAQYYTTVLLDSVDFGAGNPFEGKFSSDGEYYWIAVSGTNEVMGVDFEALTEKLEAENIRDLPLVTNQLSYISYVSKRTKINGQAPRDIIVTGDHVYVLNYFSESVEKYRSHELLLVNEGILNLQNGLLGKENQFDIATDDIKEWGEYLFQLAAMSFQNWQSCISCHPGARTDGLNWDLLNDGLGNPKQTKSMLHAHQTAPSMITGIRASAEVAVRKGVTHILFMQRPEMEMIAMDQYLANMKPFPSPYLAANGVLTAQQKRGKTLATQAGCLSCHSGQYYTDQKKYAFGLGTDREKVREFDTPTLIEIWRTPPYMYDGRCETLFDMLKESRETGKHGNVQKMSDADLKAIEAWLLTL